jgi:hypothetical protein
MSTHRQLGRVAASPHRPACPHAGASRRRPAQARIGALAVSVLVAVAAFACSTSSAVAAENATEGGCPNEQFRQGPAAYLPDCRAYEMVTPPYKGGYGATYIEAVSSEGDRVGFFSPGAFAGAPQGPDLGVDYVAIRGVTGWMTVPIQPPSSLTPTVEYKDVTQSLDSTLVFGPLGTNEEGAAQNAVEWNALLHPIGVSDATSTWGPAGPVLTRVPGSANSNFRLSLRYMGATPDFCHVFFRPGDGSPLLPEAIGYEEGVALYELDRGCGSSSPSLHLVTLNNSQKPISANCEAVLGIEDYGTQHIFNAFSSDGTEVFFTTCTANSSSGPHQVFVRLGDTRTLEVSKPMTEACAEVPCKSAGTRASANFVGASEDGAEVFFTTSATLSETDEDSGNDLYMARIGCPAGEGNCEPAQRTVLALVQVSHAQRGVPADVQGVVKIAPDGRRVYYVAEGDLLSEAERHALEAQGRPTPKTGAYNFYVYDSSTGGTQFIGDLCGREGLSGEVEDAQCPRSAPGDNPLFENSSVEAQTADSEGRYLVFSTDARLAVDDVDEAKDVYRYDAQSGALQRVSLGEAGYDANGNRPFDAEIAVTTSDLRTDSLQNRYEMSSRAVSEDGSRIVFTTVEPLSTRATNGLTNVYEWQAAASGGEGGVSLISSGSSAEPDFDTVISPDGRNVFFDTVQGLVPHDTDGLPDIYDAREDGGFPPVPAEGQPCAGDACQGPLTNPAPLLVPGSVSQAPGEELSAPLAAPTKSKAKPRKKVRRGKRKTRRAGNRRRARR